MKGLLSSFPIIIHVKLLGDNLKTMPPKIAEFFRNFTAVKDLRPDLYNNWKYLYNR